MKLSVLFKRIQHAVIQMPELEEEMEIRGITCNSQKAEEDSLFVCIQGSRADGHDYIEEACNLGASCILIEKLVSGGRMLKFPENVAVVLVKDTREALAGISRIWFGSPADKLKVIGVTGTKGKSTVAVMIREMLESLGQKCGLIGTIGHHLGNEVVTSQNTTPDAFTIQSYFAKMVEAGCHYAVMEVSSQGIKQHRIDGIWFEIAVFTNFGEDHIGPGEHASLGEYRYYKSCLFEQCRIGIGNLDDAQCSYMFQRKCCTKYGFTCREEGQERGFRNSHVLTAEKISFLMEGGELKTVFYADDRKYELALPGKFNVYNAGHSSGRVHAAVRLRPYRGLVRQPHGGAHHLPPHHASGVPRRHHPRPLHPHGGASVPPRGRIKRKTLPTIGRECFFHRICPSPVTTSL